MRRPKGDLADSDEWGTPRPLFDAMSEGRGFVFDLFASKSNALCMAFLTKEDDALTVQWHLLAPGCWLWMNPPFSRPSRREVGNLDRCSDAMREAVTRGARIAGVVPSSTSADWFQRNILRPFVPSVQEVQRVGPLRGVTYVGSYWAGERAVPGEITWLSYRPRFINGELHKRKGGKSGSGRKDIVAFAFDGWRA